MPSNSKAFLLFLLGVDGISLGPILMLQSHGTKEWSEHLFTHMSLAWPGMAISAGSGLSISLFMQPLHVSSFGKKQS